MSYLKSLMRIALCVVLPRVQSRRRRVTAQVDQVIPIEMRDLDGRSALDRVAPDVSGSVSPSMLRHAMKTWNTLPDTLCTRKLRRCWLESALTSRR